MKKEVRIYSDGGGGQSNAVMVLQAAGKLPEPYDYFIFANVGNDSENPATLDYMEQYKKPFCEAHGIRFIEVQKTLRTGELDTLVGMIDRTERSVPIPARMSNGAPGNRSCTSTFKISVVDKWVKQNGYTHAVVGLGISLDECHRMRDEQWHDTYGTKKIGYMKKREHPLIDLRLRRDDCYRIIAEAGLPIPPKSACFFCPFKKYSEWIQMRRDQPALFAEAVRIETVCNEKRFAMGKDQVFFHQSCTPLADAVGLQLALPGFFDDASCGGYCHT